MSKPILTPDLISHLTANELGERLMRLVYVGAPDEARRSWRPQELDIRADARTWGEQEARAFYRTYLGEGEEEHPAETAYGYSFSDQGFAIDYCCYYDGDAIACFAVYKDEQLLRALENWDAKKDDRWRDHSSYAAAPYTLVTAFSDRRRAPLEDTFALTFSGANDDTSFDRNFRTLALAEKNVADVWASEQLAQHFDRVLIERVHPDLSREPISESTSPALAGLEIMPLGPRHRDSSLA